MSSATLREQLRQQIERLPDDLVLEIADFIFFVLARRQKGALYADWTEADWQEFAIEQLLRDADGDVEYSLDDAEEVFHP